MTIDAKSLYKNLSKLVEEGERTFISYDRVAPSGEFVRVFHYNYASYSDWLKPDALECRGVAFSVDKNGDMIELICLPMSKFFNLNETPFTMNIDFGSQQDNVIMDKLDGSLISSYVSKGKLYLKSKTSLISSMARESMNLLNSPEYTKLRNFIEEQEAKGYTVNMEYTAPDNRIVLSYDKKGLTVLNLRNRNTGEYLTAVDFSESEQDLFVPTFQITDIEEAISGVKEMVGIEGFVIKLQNGLWFKLKTDWYCSLHHTKDSVNSNKNLFDVVVNQGSDDVRARMNDDAWAIDKINKFEQIYRDYFTNSIKFVMEQKNTTIDTSTREGKKEFVTKVRNAVGTEGVKPWLFDVCMQTITRDEDAVVGLLGELFIKNVKQFIPEEYIVKETQGVIE